MKRLVVLCCVGAIAMAGLGAGAVSAEAKPKTVDLKPKIPDKLFAVITTDKGVIRLELFPEEAPITVANFANLADRGYYDGIKFHRVIANFMIQGGDPTGTGRSGPGYKFRDEFSPKRRHDGPGVLSMANSGPGTNGSQFFITHNATAHLNDKHSVFGKVVSGQDVVNAIAKDDVMKTVRIEGDTKSLFEQNKKQLDEWNAILDKKFPRKPTDPEAIKKLAEKKAAKQAKDRTDAQAFIKGKGVDTANGMATDSGLWYVDAVEGSGAAPSTNGRVTVHCTGWLVNKTKFYSSRDDGKPISNHPVTQFVKGFTEGLRTMKAGGKRWLVIPGDLGYRRAGNPRAKIPPDATLIFEVELVEVH